MNRKGQNYSGPSEEEFLRQLAVRSQVGQSAPANSSIFGEELKGFDEALQMLDKCVDAFVARLEPVMGPDLREPSGEVSERCADEERSPLTAAMVIRRRRVEALRFQLERALARVEV